MLPHLDSGYAVDQAILSEEDRVVIIRFGHDWDPVRIASRLSVFIELLSTSPSESHTVSCF